MDATILSRLQFAFTIGYHILWPTLTIGLSAFVAWLSLLWWWTGKPVYRDLMRFWMQIFALGFGMGVITGLVMSYEIGTNWAGYSKAVGNVLGPLFMYEAAMAFFLEFRFRWHHAVRRRARLARPPSVRMRHGCARLIDERDVDPRG